jgi:shikimate dehydrogenase
MPDPDRYLLFGHPVSHSWSPFIHSMFAHQLGHHIEYRLRDVTPEKFRGVALEFFAGGGRGANITVPHKLAAAELANQLTPRATRAGAVNVLSRADDHSLLGDNTDGTGLVADLTRNLGVTLKGSRVLVLGAGGAVRGMLAPLLAEGPSQLLIANRTVARAQELASAFAALGPVTAGGFGDAGEAPWDLVINATSAGLSAGSPSVPDSAVGPASVCYDMFYSRSETPFQQWAAARGVVHSHQGWGMLVEQAAEAYLVWRGVRPDTGPVRTALARL